MDAEFSQTKEYGVGPGTIDLGRPYEQKMVALISLRCLRENVDNVEIAFNAADLGALDDVVIIARKKEGEKIKILLQLKHEDKEKDLVDTLFLADKGNYSLLKYCKDILKLKERLDCETAQTSIINDLGTFKNTYFILFTNKGTDKLPFLDNDGCDAISFLNTNAHKDNLYKFDLTKVSELSSLPQIDYNFYLFAKQSHVNHLQELIESEMEKVFRYFELTHYSIKNDDNIKIVSNAFVEYVTDWSMGKLGGHHYLTKHAILYKLTELLLKQYELDISREKFAFYVCPQKELWNEVVKDKRITIVDSDEEVIRFLKLYVGSEVKSCCQELGKTWSCKFLNEEQNWFYEKYKNLKKAMLKVVGNNGKITLLSVYKCLWFNESLPLLLNINTLDDYEVILKILKLSGFKLKVIILTNLKLKPTDVEPDYFTTLSNLNDKERLRILNNSVKLQGRSSVTLREVIDESLFSFINCNVIINILMGSFNIGVAYKPLDEYFIDISLLKVSLEMGVLAVLDEFFVIKINQETGDLVEGFKCNTNVIIVDAHNPIQIEKLKLKSKRIHQLVFDHNNYILEWKKSFGSTNRIKYYKVSHLNNFEELKDVLANRNANNFLNKVNLVSASPGMGKSTLLDRISSIASTKMWVLNVNLSEHDDYYAERLKTGEDHLKYFNNSILKNQNCNDIQLAQSVFQKFLNRKQVLVLLDAMDEVSVSFKTEAVEIINSIHKAGFSVWLTTRPHLATELEEKFGTISTTLRPFSVIDQKRFLNKYFKHIGDTLNVATNQPLIEEFVERLLQASRNNLNDRDGEFTGIPLQTKLLANAFSNQFKEWLANRNIKFEVKFDLLYLYEELMQSKEKILYDKFGKGGRNMKSLFQEHQQLFALKLLFTDRYLFRLDIYNQLKDYYNNEDKIQCLQQEGVTVIQRSFKQTSTFHVNFAHRTFAEYLAALWLFNNFNGRCDNSKLTARLLLKQRYSKFNEYELLFRMFDCILGRDSRLHLSIIYGRLDEALELIKLNPDVRDKCGRSFLHIIALYGTDGRADKLHTEVKNEMTEFVDKIPADKIKNTRDILGYTPLDYALRNCSFSVANKLCEKSKQLTISANTNIYDRWVIRIRLEDSMKYETLLKTILPFLICQRLLLECGNLDTSIVDYCNTTVIEFIAQEEIVNKCTNELGLTTISDLLVKMNIKSADTAQIYYYDLGFAVAYGSILNVQELILSQYWFEQYNFYTPLYLAIRYNRLEIVKLLIFYGENIHQVQNCFRSTNSLLDAVQFGNIEIVRELLRHQADVNFQSDDGYTPLSAALECNNIEIAKLLLAHNSRIDIKDIRCRLPLYYAVSRGLDDLIPDLIKGVDVNRLVSSHEPPLLVAVKREHVSTVRVLLRYGADCNIPDHFNTLPIHIVAAKGFDEVLPAILPKTLEGVNLRTEEGRTPLHLSICGEESNRDYRYSNNRTKIAKFLLNNGADPNIQDNKGNTSLHYLCNECPLNNKDRKIVAGLLTDKGADVNLKNNDGNTALLHLLKVLHEQDNLGSHFEFFSFLIQEDNVNVQNNQGNTALHCLFVAFVLPIDDIKSWTKLILKKGADVNIINNNGDSCLHLFLCYLFTYDRKRKLFGIFPLVIRESNVNIQDSDGNTPLHYCCSIIEFHKFDKKIIKLLLEKGADVNLKNKDGETPLDLAHRFNLTEIVSLLQRKRPVLAHCSLG